MVYSFRPLVSTDLPQMYRSFREAFSDYPLPFRLSKSAFNQRMLEKINIDLAASWGAFSNEKLVGFLFQSINWYEGKLCAYNAGTGVIPGHRGQGITKILYKNAKEQLNNGEVGCCVLEVLEANVSAYKTYESIGFKKSKTFSCWQSDGKIMPSNSCEIQITGRPDFELYSEFDQSNSAFGDTFEQLVYNLSNEECLEAIIDDKIVGYLIYQPLLGRISRFAVKEEFQRKGVGTTLFTRAKKTSKKNLTVLNIQQSDQGVLAFLEALNFKFTVTQFEMQLDLK